MNKHVKFRKALSMLLAVIMCMSSFSTFAIVAGSADLVSASESMAKISGVDKSNPGVEFSYTKEVRDNGSGSFKLVLNGTVETVFGGQPTNKSKYNSGSFTATRDGWYAVQVWGGAGGMGDSTTIIDGSSLADSLLDTSNLGGEGGAAGYVEAAVYLTEGQVLAYGVGTNGTEVQKEDNGTSGVSEGGDAGGHGSFGSYGVGSGGGSSEVFLFDSESEYEEALSYGATSKEYRQHYILVAGGGGGGSAHSLIQVRRGDGGDAGSCLTCTPVACIDPYTGAAGVYYAGEDGISTGDDSNYVGRGGTDAPGKGAKNYFELLVDLEPAEDGNDWYGDYDPTRKPGAGGHGNARGGGGGAGFAGGSGSTQTSTLVTALGCGGGGGGSSYMAVNDNMKAIPSEATVSRENPNSNVGGAVIITTLQDDGTIYDPTALESTMISGSLGSYFTIIGASAGVNFSGNSFYGEVNLRPENTSSKKMNEFYVVGVAVPGFMGGNKIKFLESLTMTTGTSHEQDFDFTIDPHEDTDYVNVELRDFSVTTADKSIMRGDSVAVNTLYVDDNLHGNVPTTSGYAYIQSISDYTVKLGTTPVTGNVSPTYSTYYTISYDVGVKNASTKAKVGKANPSVVTISSRVAVMVTSADSVHLDGTTIDELKTLTYKGDGKYDLTLSYTGPVTQAPPEIVAKNVLSTTSDTTYIVPSDGLYYVVARGGAGGNGDNQQVKHEDNGETYITTQTWGRWEGVGVEFKFGRHSIEAKGGTGAPGSVIGTSVYLTKGTVLTIDVGDKGANAPDTYECAGGTGVLWSKYFILYNPTVAKGGTATYVKNGSTNIVIAGGGGAGGNGCAGSFGVSDHINNGSAGSTEYRTDGSYDGQDGSYNYAEPSNGVYTMSTLTSGNKPAKSGPVYEGQHDIEVAEYGFDTWLRQSSAYRNIADNIATVQPSTGVKIYQFPTTEPQGVIGMDGMDIAGEITRYFKITGAESKVGSANTITYNDSTTYSSFSVDNITPATISEGVAQYIAVIHLERRDGFVGGNNVPLLRYSSNGGTYSYGININRSGETTATTDDSHDMAANVETDTANVPIDISFLENNFEGKDMTAFGADILPMFVSNELELQMKLNVANMTFEEFKGMLVDAGTELSDEEIEEQYASLTEGVPQGWMTDFVEYGSCMVDADGNDVDRLPCPTDTTSYIVKAYWEPKTTAANATAIVATPVERVGVTDSALISVEYSINYLLSPEGAFTVISDTVAESDGDYEFVDTFVGGGDYYTAEIKVSGYEMPSDITVRIGITTLDPEEGEYVFDAATGILTIPGEYINGNVTVSMEGVPLPYTITYNAYDADGTSIVETHTAEYYAGDTISHEWENAYKATADANAATGYELIWVYQGESGVPDEMPAKNMFVDGYYIKKQYQLTINYVYEGGGKAADSISGKLSFDSNYSVKSPVIDGYTADKVVTAGVMPSEDTVITVTYTAIPANTHNLTIYYQYDKGGIAAEAYSGVVEEGSSYSVTSPAIEGYAPDTATVLGTMGTSDVSVTVKYSKVYTNVTISFNPNGGTLSKPADASRTYYAGEKYSVAFPNFPQVSRAASGDIKYQFDGWYTLAEGGTKVNTSDVAPSSAQTLYAHWTELSTTITFSANGGKFADESTEKTQSRDYGQTYPTVETPTRAGYEFLGWYTSTGAMGKIELGTDTFTSNSARTLYAGWKLVDSATVIFKSNGFVVKKLTFDVSDTYTFNLEKAPVAGGYFKGWTYTNGGDPVTKTLKYNAKNEITVTDTTDDTSMFELVINAEYYGTTAVETNETISRAMAQRVVLSNGNTYIRFISVMSKDGYDAESEQWTDRTAAGFVVTTADSNETPTIEAGMQYNKVTGVYGKIRTNGKKLSVAEIGKNVAGFEDGQGSFYTNYPVPTDKSTKIAVTPYVLLTTGEYIYGKTKILSYAELEKADHDNGIYLSNEVKP